MHAAVRLCGGWCCQCCVWSGWIRLCLVGDASLHVWYAAVSVSFWSKVKRVACTNLVQRPVNTQQPDWVFSRHTLRSVYGVFQPVFKIWHHLEQSETVRAHRSQTPERVHNNVHQVEIRTFSSRSPKIWTTCTTLDVTVWMNCMSEYQLQLRQQAAAAHQWNAAWSRWVLFMKCCCGLWLLLSSGVFTSVNIQLKHQFNRMYHLQFICLIFNWILYKDEIFQVQTNKLCWTCSQEHFINCCQ